MIIYFIIVLACCFVIIYTYNKLSIGVNEVRKLPVIDLLRNKYYICLNTSFGIVIGKSFYLAVFSFKENDITNFCIMIFIIIILIFSRVYFINIRKMRRFS